MEDKPKATANERLEAWKQTIQVQQHFNDIELRIRNYAITLLGALFGIAAYAFKEHVESGVILCVLLGGLFLCYAFYFMDRHWYHRLLIGAVEHGQMIESSSPAELGLTGSIGRKSPVKLWYRKKELHSDDKILIFYGFIALAIVAMAVGTFFFASGAEPTASGIRQSQSPSSRAVTGADAQSALGAKATPLLSPTVSPGATRATPNPGISPDSKKG
jgi:hypothetical protein